MVSQEYDPITHTWVKGGAMEFKNVKVFTYNAIEDAVSSLYGKIRTNNWNAPTTIIFDPVEGGDPNFVDNLQDVEARRNIGALIGQRIMYRYEHPQDTGYGLPKVVIFTNDYNYTG